MGNIRDKYEIYEKILFTSCFFYFVAEAINVLVFWCFVLYIYICVKSLPSPSSSQNLSLTWMILKKTNASRLYPIKRK